MQTLSPPPLAPLDPLLAPLRELACEPPPEPPRLSAQALADMAACRAALREGSYTFYAASLMLPRAVREPASALYAFCRLADDAVDQGGDQQAAVARLRTRLDGAYRGCPEPITADRALAAVVAHFAIPRELPEALLEGFEWDAQSRRYTTLDELQGYAARVAGTVGAMMACLMGVRSAEGLARACDLGVAMQLSNIARDVGEDARMGRLYLPLEWMQAEGVDPVGWLARPEFNAGIARVVKRLLDAAQTLYDRVDAGVAQLPLACRPGINAARFLYADIGHEVARRGLDSVSQRAVVSRTRKLVLLARAVAGLYPAPAAQPAPCLPATRFLVEAACVPATSADRSSATASSAWWRVTERIGERVAWVVDLFERLERRDQAAQQLPLRLGAAEVQWPVAPGRQ